MKRKKKETLAQRLRRMAGDRPKSKWSPRPELLNHPTIPAPMHGLNPRTVLGGVWWNEVRQAAYESTNYHCAACGVHKYKAKGKKHLEAHETYDIDYLSGRMVYAGTVPLCHFCHNYIHRGRLNYLLDSRKITQARYAAIIQHGDEVLENAGLSRCEEYLGPAADWGDWRLVVEGKEYPPIYASPEDLDNHYAKNG